MQDWAAACVCKVWRQGWADIAAQRRGLRTGRQLGELDFRLGTSVMLAAHPSGEWLAVTNENSSPGHYHTQLVDPAMRTLQAIPTGGVTGIAVSDDFIYATHISPRIQRYSARPPFAWSWSILWRSTATTDFIARALAQTVCYMSSCIHLNRT
uniref:Uncharacterized protein n=1 Tax=Haptolina ericina TaxID=156174 RepID=A0A7S3FIB4_9EUKA